MLNCASALQQIEFHSIFLIANWKLFHHRQDFFMFFFVFLRASRAAFRRVDSSSSLSSHFGAEAWRVEREREKPNKISLRAPGIPRRELFLKLIYLLHTDRSAWAERRETAATEDFDIIERRIALYALKMLLTTSISSSLFHFFFRFRIVVTNL